MEDFLSTQVICSVKLREFRGLALTGEKLANKRLFLISRDTKLYHMEKKTFSFCVKELKLIFRVWNYLPGAMATE